MKVQKPQERREWVRELWKTECELPMCVIERGRERLQEAMGGMNVEMTQTARGGGER